MRVEGVNRTERMEFGTWKSREADQRERVRRNEIERVIDELARRSLQERRGALSRLKIFYKALQKSLLDLFG